MSTEFFNDQWRIPSNENQSKVSNYSMEFDGTSTEVDLGISPANLIGAMKPYSVSAWVYVAQSDLGSGTNYFIIGAQDGIDRWYFRIQSGYARFAYGTYLDSTTLTTITGDQWSHVVFTYDGVSEFNTYINGINKSTVTNSAIQGVPSFNAFIGALNAGSGGINQFKGKLDQVTVFDYALPATGTNSVATLYGGGTAVTNPMSLSPKPIAYYQLGDQSVDNGANYLVPNNSLSDYVFDFNGSSQNINIDNEITLSNNKSLSFWLKFDTIPTQSGSGPIPLSSSTNNYYPMIAVSSGNIRLYIKGTNGFINTVTSTAVIANIWYHIVITGDGTNALYYINGGADSGGIGIDRTGVSIKSIGSRLNGSSRSLYVDGQMSNVAIWDNTTLTSAQVATLYNNGAPSDISSLSPVAWYKLNAADTFDGTDWTINDYGSGGNDGTSSGMDSSNLVVSDLQQTNGFSPYALDFDGADDYLTITSTDFKGSAGTVSYSFWVKPETYGNPSGTQNFGYFISDSSTGGGIAYSEGGTGSGLTPGQMYLYNMTNAGAVVTTTSTIIDENVWNNIVIVFNTGNIVQFYKNGSLSSTLTGVTSFNATWDTIATRRYSGVLSNLINGDLSNFSIFDTALTFSEVTEIYNQGVPSNLNNFSGTAPVAWWQLGSNSSFNTNWTCLDEIGTNNAVSVNMTNDDIVDGPGYSASGLGTSTIDIKGDAPYSTANGLSENMDVLDRVKDVPS